MIRHLDYVRCSISYLFNGNSIVIYFSDTKSTKNNFGDALNPLIVNHLSNKKVYSKRKLLQSTIKPVFSVIGSILDNLQIENLEIWGSGFISMDGRIKTEPKKIHAVRGPLTRNILLSQGYNCPEVYGDPALLLPLMYSPQVNKKYKIGIIPHFIDKDNTFITGFKNKNNQDVLIIDIEGDIKTVVDDINRCECIASSSLHGIIVADAYGIPSLWIELSDNVIGSGFKFRDYMLSVGRKQLHPLVINKPICIEELARNFEKYQINFDFEDFLKSCPFILEDFILNRKCLFKNETDMYDV